MLMRCEPGPVVQPCAAGAGESQRCCCCVASRGGVGGVGGGQVECQLDSPSPWPRFQWRSRAARQAPPFGCGRVSSVGLPESFPASSKINRVWRVIPRKKDVDQYHDNYWSDRWGFCLSKGPHAPTFALFWNVKKNNNKKKKNSPNSATSKHLQLLNNGGRCECVRESGKATHEC